MLKGTTNKFFIRMKTPEIKTSQDIEPIWWGGWGEKSNFQEEKWLNSLFKKKKTDVWLPVNPIVPISLT